MNDMNFPHGDGPVALFLPTLDGGGAERAFVNLARGMVEIGIDVDLVVGNASGPFRSEVPKNVNLIDLKAPRLIRALPGLVRYLKLRSPRRLYSALEEAGLIALLARSLSGKSLPVIPSIRNRLTEEARLGGMKRRGVIVLARRFFRQADALIAVSDGVAEDAAQVLDLPVDRISVIRNPTIVPEMIARSKLPIDDPWFSTDAPPVVLACGRLSAQKDYKTLIRAFAEVRKTQAVRLLILGEGPMRSQLHEQISDLSLADDIALPGFDPNPFRYMARCSVFVLSSIFEGSPNVLVQAIACGAAVVSTDCPSGPNEILHNVESAELVPVGDFVAMAKAIERLLERQPRERTNSSMAPYDYLFAARRYLEVAV
ncbi:glycosyltransferase [Ruegeria arenilitoris]|uniref:glycosyltransferase n=1 Tax=Ruegeria arenilitoris TaxID=1173585 RepID=UPI00147BF258|nr:glycosyltransferase [Ruegeria arenilitoris]